VKASARLLVVLVVLSALLWVTGNSGGVFHRVLDTARTLVATWNLRSLRQVVLDSRILEKADEVAAWSQEEFSDFVRENLRSRGPGADPALDPWLQPYRLDPLGDTEPWVLSSTGPNLEVDLCPFEGAGGDDVCVLVEPALTE